ncbi:F-box/LRR-repeat protein 7 [Wyeomyia smithii]|uniref:F-box/LRR-repeat protein 7 n=1 Tax=Wyeomyia smithii TaxID=174621 RepID=UPI0024682105|nr:F-box/LRR-repeat protein 7 [Wyeomyia smithii]XP_055545275.1 F-box/LRR-repeat protein 7 [Wyeomyia smithii]XP_055545276.1 F-box/LRR-repeat protein 7 [Wyeomyia smithii]XP_055545277.1 F-box/LRR-repeat protein 7 [Wyeomyia smithii]XP_055545279.1 F-box/LRR-repeat protein 7 [Wyeomyia smithii]XP_055545280.1 F-box/LRR-repeat protein 7 [Wyeomyia smithii]XP_055545281.1 F-box/LRR-repeat protein 7 [Wyeomyia smithii]XP_055545282.1 F-box/LRR-repeat protein 7 [Wyeomyia smithii]XP_055545283.1 F-box/LRR-re
MSHSQRRGAPVECPLASLGRNTPSMDALQYHHPLSSSPLDPQAYQMSRKTPILGIDPDIYTGTNIVNNHSNNKGCKSDAAQENGNLLSISSPSSLDQSASFLHQSSPPTLNRRGDFRPLRPQTYTPIDALLTNTYQQHQRLSPVMIDIQRNHMNYQPETQPLATLSEADRYFLEEKMDSLYIQGAIRRNANTPSSLTRNQSSSSNNTERYYLENENIDAIYNFCHNTAGVAALNAHNSSLKASSSHNDCLDSSSPNLLRRASSPDTSGSDRYLIERIRGSPGYHGRNGCLSQQMKVSTTDFVDGRMHSSKSQHFSDGLKRYGRFSPSLDQGYHTLVSPSPSGHQQSSIPASWNTIAPSGNSLSANTTGCLNSSAHLNNVVNSDGLNGGSSALFRSGPIFDRLSDELITKVFEWLDSSDLCNIARVCKRFEMVIWNQTLWNVIKIKGENNSGDRAIKTILRRLCGQTRNGICPGVERVLLSDGCRLTDKGLQLLSRRCPEITHLQVQNSVAITNQALFHLVTKCTNLQHLDITGCAQITCINVNPGLESPRRLLLQYLDLTDCASISDSGLKIIARNCPLLVYLYLRRCIQISDAGLKFIPNFCIALRELSVSDCTSITDFGLYELAKLGATLRYLSVAKCDQVSDAGLKVIARRCYKMRYLNARGCEAVSDDSINVLARSCPRLRALDIGKCDVSDAGLRALAESCPNLKKLSLRNCDMITDRGIQCIAYYCRGLQQLNIQDCQISIEGYRAVKKYCKRCVIEHTNPGFC